MRCSGDRMKQLFPDLNAQDIAHVVWTLHVRQLIICPFPPSPEFPNPDSDPWKLGGGCPKGYIGCLWPSCNPRHVMNTVSVTWGAVMSTWLKAEVRAGERGVRAQLTLTLFPLCGDPAPAPGQLLQEPTSLEAAGHRDPAPSLLGTYYNIYAIYTHTHIYLTYILYIYNMYL